MERLTSLASGLLLAASAALTAGCMADAADETLDEDTTQAARAESSDADEARADGEAVGESSQAFSACFAPRPCYRPEIVTNWVSYVNWTAVPEVTYRYFATLHHYPQSHLVYRPYFRPVTCFVPPC
ncbi:uncharacterized protein SOCEGT47_048640 [Sorangium cellulosum]|uniref:Secreted protein n=1 Tax=Sorangium cellulosum TaxID=56 RepID=A0A4P2Q4L7_SORCE|nr:hypothetical protein [Sorangium cellulosum]AUX24327.1 uncharacterized protein SOCEGT47_048640 [Sorangium cellulosum]